jgi:hypothetical protein
MSFGDIASLAAIGGMIAGAGWLASRWTDYEVEELYRGMRTLGLPRFVAVPVTMVFAMISAC